jgi:hypothetical protein
MLAAVLGGVCLLGADFARPDPASFTLGETTEPQIRQRFGGPDDRVAVKVDGKAVTILRYRHADPQGPTVPVREMAFAFHLGRLVGHEYSSSFPADQTTFDEAAAKRIKRGETTRAEVLALVGKPTGEFIYPSPQATRPEHRTYIYNFFHRNRVAASKTLDTTIKVLAVVFDAQDVVLQTSLTTRASSVPTR